MRVSILFLIIFAVVLISTGVSEAYIFDLWNLVINEGETLTLSGHHKFVNSVIINGTINIPESNGTLVLEAKTITIGPKGIINGDAAGYIDGAGAGQDAIDCGVDMPGGGGYGGKGADGFAFDFYYDCSAGFRIGGPANGSKSFPDVRMGSGGGEYNLASDKYHSRGGGAIKLVASDKIIVRGTLTVNGDEHHGPEPYAPCATGGGSGGGILIFAPEVILNGLLSARGGGRWVGPCWYACTGGGGGGGRIKICYKRLYRNLFSTFDVSEGDPAWCDSSYWDYPEPGTVSIIDMSKWPY